MRNDRPIRARSSRGYTLVELIMVSALAVVVLSISVAAYYAWTRSTSSETAVTELESMLARARSHALARQRATRVLITPGPRGDFVVAERQLEQGKDSWLPIAPSNRLAWTRLSWDGQPSPPSAGNAIYFRKDGSCCLDYDDMDRATVEEDAFQIDLENIPGRESKARGRLRTILLDPGSGLSTVRERSYGDDGR